MLFIKKSVILILLSVLIPFIAFQEPKMEDIIISYFKNSDSRKLAQYFNQNVEVAVSGNKNIYSKAQAQQIVAKFFKDNKPESFKIHSNTIEKETQNIIGLLDSKDNSFRVYIVIKKTDGKDVIHILKIENREKQITSP